MKKLLVPTLVTLAALAIVLTTTTVLGRGGGPKDRPVVYVRSQGLYYDSIVGPDLPPNGPFQRLFHPDYDPVSQLETEYGPGDQGYVGGRWWIDTNGDDQMDPGDKYFSCPLQGPGRETATP